MGCVHCDFNGVCQLYDSDSPPLEMCCDPSGICYCEEDHDPLGTCKDYESDEIDEEDE